MAEPCTMIICGATGDLTERKLAPPVQLLPRRFLPPEFTGVGFARRDWTDDQFRDHLLAGINKYSRNHPVKPEIWDSIAPIEYQRGDFNDPAAYELAKRLDRIDRDRGTAGNRLFYLAVPPSLYPEIVNHLHRAANSRRARGRSRHRHQAGWAHDREAVRLRPRVGANAEPSR